MEVRSVRTQEIRLYKLDEPELNIRYTGRSDSMLALDSDPVWQIMREYRIADNTIVEYANKGSFTARWADRVSYFSPATPDASQPLSGVIAVTGTFSPSGLSVGGLITEVTLSAASWTALPPTALTGRNQMSIQNISGVEIKVNYDSFGPLPAGYSGTAIASGSERHYLIRDTINIYAKASSGTPTIQIEELA